MRIIFLILASCFWLLASANATPPAFLQTQIGGTNLVGWWTFNEGSGSSIADSSGRNQTGVLSNSPVFVTGIIGKALNFSGATNQSVNISTNGFIQSASALTLTAWVYLTNNPPLVTGGQIVIRWNDSASDDSFSWKLNNSSAAKPRLVISPSGTYNATYDLTAASSIPLNQWVFLAATFTGTSLNLYTNGVLSDTKSVSSSGIHSSGQPIFFGADQLNGANAWFQGTLDDVRIFASALTQTQIQQLCYINADGSVHPARNL